MSDPRSARVRHARRLARRAFRDRTGLFLVEGPQAVREAARFVDGLFVTEAAAARHPDLLVGIEGKHIVVVTDEVLESLAETVTPQGVVAICRSPLVDSVAALQGQPRLVVVLDEVREPGNLGTVVRCADAAGAAAVLCTHGSVDPLNGKAVRASAGSLFHLPVALTADLPSTLSSVRAAGCQVLATDGEGDLDLDAAIDSGLLAGPTAWLFGTEAHGLTPEQRSLADRVVRIPMYGRAESLNLATAAAVTLFASAREQRR